MAIASSLEANASRQSRTWAARATNSQHAAGTTDQLLHRLLLYRKSDRAARNVGGLVQFGIFPVPPSRIVEDGPSSPCSLKKRRAGPSMPSRWARVRARIRGFGSDVRALPVSQLGTSRATPGCAAGTPRDRHLPLPIRSRAGHVLLVVHAHQLPFPSGSSSMAPTGRSKSLVAQDVGRSAPSTAHALQVIVVVVPPPGRRNTPMGAGASLGFL